MSYSDKIRLLRNQAKREEITVLIWGPGDPGPTGDIERQKYWTKRVQIKEVLQREFPNAEIAFSEDRELRELTAGLEDLLVEELVHAAVADCILVLDVSRGAHVEVDRLTAYPLVAQKIRLLLPERFVGTTGLVSVIHQGVRVSGYTDADFEACRLATKQCVDIVLSIAIDKRLRS